MKLLHIQHDCIRLDVHTCVGIVTLKYAYTLSSCIHTSVGLITLMHTRWLRGTYVWACCSDYVHTSVGLITLMHTLLFRCTYVQAICSDYNQCVHKKFLLT
jgi:hypothetical protein